MIPLGEVVTFDVITSDPATGAAGDAAAIVYDVYEDEADTPILADQTMTKRFLGHYRGNFTVTSTPFDAGKWYNVIVEATVGGVAAKAIVMTFRAGTAEGVAGVANANTVAINDDITAAVNLALSAQGIIPGLCETGTLSVSQATTNLTGYAANELVGAQIIFTGGVANKQRSWVTAAVVANGLLTWAPDIITPPANNDPFILV